MDIALIVALASLPFVAKGATLWLGLTGYVAQSSYKVLQLVIPFGWRYVRGKRGFSPALPNQKGLPFIRWLNLGVALALLFAGLAIAGILLVGPAIGLHPHAIREAFDRRFNVQPAAAIYIVFFLSSLNAGLEELHFRVWLDRELTKRLTSFVGVPVSAFAFAAMHGFILAGMPGIPGAAILAMVGGLFVAGMCWSFLLRRPGGVYAAWLSHGLTDALLLTWGLFWLGYL